MVDLTWGRSTYYAWATCHNKSRNSMHGARSPTTHGRQATAGAETRWKVPSGVVRSPSDLMDQVRLYSSKANIARDMLVRGMDSHWRTTMACNTLAEDTVKLMVK
ncbi:hypothetical protein GW17_00023396, partial [Ensete ventricosum]